MLALKNISFGYGKQPVLTDVNLKAEKGEICCLVGASASGKSTILRLIAGLEKVRSGEITLHNQIASSTAQHLPPETRGVGLVFQHPSLFPHLTVLANVMFGLKGMPKKEAKAIARDLLEQVRYHGDAEAYPHMLSGGQHQRVALARALAPAPSVLLLDEPFANLDNILREQVRRDVFALLRARKTTTIMVTHDPKEALHLADNVHLLGRGGAILQSSCPEKMYYQPQTPFVAEFFGDTNLLSAADLATFFGEQMPEQPDETPVAMLRPELVTIHPTPSDSSKSQHAATITQKHFFGHYSLLEATTSEGLRLLAMDSKHLPVHVGDEVYLSADAAHLHRFPAAA